MSDADDLYKLARGIASAAKQFSSMFEEPLQPKTNPRDRVEPVDIKEYLAMVSVHDVGTGIPANLAEALRLINQEGRKYGIHVQFLAIK